MEEYQLASDLFASLSVGNLSNMGSRNLTLILKVSSRSSMDSSEKFDLVRLTAALAMTMSTSLIPFAWSSFTACIRSAVNAVLLHDRQTTYRGSICLRVGVDLDDHPAVDLGHRRDITHGCDGLVAGRGEGFRQLEADANEPVSISEPCPQKTHPLFAPVINTVGIILDPQVNGDKQETREKLGCGGRLDEEGAHVRPEISVGSPVSDIYRLQAFLYGYCCSAPAG